MFSIIRDDFAYTLQRRLGLIPANGLGIVRRAIFWSMLAWLPIVAWAFISGRLTHHIANEPLMGHFGIHVRFLIAVPLLMVAGGVVHAAMARLLPQFITSGVVPTEELPRLKEIISGIARLRGASLPWLLIFGIVLARATVGDIVHQAHEIEWATTPDGGRMTLGFGAWWFLYVGRPIYLTLQLAWMWRLILLFMLFSRIANLKLSLVPTHPDRAGGLGFLAGIPGAFAPIMFATTVVLAGMFAHDVVYHGVSVPCSPSPVSWAELEEGLFLSTELWLVSTDDSFGNGGLRSETFQRMECSALLSWGPSLMFPRCTIS